MKREGAETERERERLSGQPEKNNKTRPRLEGLPSVDTLKKLGPESGRAAAERNQIKGSRDRAAGTPGWLMTHELKQVKRLVCKVFCTCLAFQDGEPTSPLPAVQNASWELKTGSLQQPPERAKFFKYQFLIRQLILIKL